MAELTWSVSVKEDGGTVVTANSDDVGTEATGYVQVAIDPGETDKEVTVLPGAAADVDLIVVKSSYYGGDLSYKASDGTTDSGPVVLDGPQVFSTGSVALFGVDPNSLKFTNGSTDKTAKITIYVARDATP